MIRIFLLLVSFTFILACGGASDAERVQHGQFFAFGTTIELSLYGVNEQQFEAAMKKAQEDFEYLHFAWHPYESGPLARINGLLPTQEFFSYAPSVMPLIQLGIKYEKLSDGCFNPAMGKLIKLWGFDHPETLEGRKPPDQAAIDAVLKHMPSMADLQIKGMEMKSNNKDVQLDFGGVAKGLGVDRVIEELQKIGVRNVIVNAGGDLRAIGSKGGKPWSIGIRHPRHNGVIASIDVKGDESVFTSGDYERYFEYQGKRYDHILSPFTGYPASDFQSVTVVTNNASLADAAATALSVAGKKDWQRIAKRMGVDQVMLVDQNSKVYLTSKLQKRVQLVNVDPSNVIVSEPQ